jgi:hypothetical protein
MTKQAHPAGDEAWHVFLNVIGDNAVPVAVYPMVDDEDIGPNLAEVPEYAALQAACERASPPEQPGLQNEMCRIALTLARGSRREALARMEQAYQKYVSDPSFLSARVALYSGSDFTTLFVLSAPDVNTRHAAAYRDRASRLRERSSEN